VYVCNFSADRRLRRRSVPALRHRAAVRGGNGSRVDRR
jgi:hypothetical protein